jgi:hypothetical protein
MTVFPLKRAATELSHSSGYELVVAARSRVNSPISGPISPVPGSRFTQQVIYHRVMLILPVTHCIYG